jgi:hypothetical protein
VEPLVTHYARRAECYRSIQSVLVDGFGKAALGGLHRQTVNGCVERTVKDELEFMAALFDGAANVARLELGASPIGDTGTFVWWMANRRSDPDISADLRMMVPVYWDQERKLTKVWMFLGWLEDTLEVEFENPPAVRRPDGSPVSTKFQQASYPVAVPVTVEALTSRVLNRDAFRSLCDRHRTPEAVVRALQ